MEEGKNLEQRLKTLLEEKKTLKELYAANLAYGKSIGMQAVQIDEINRAYGHQTRLQTEIAKRLDEGVRYEVTKSGKLTKVAATEREILATKKILANLEDGQLDLVRDRVQATADLAKAELMYETGLKDSYAEQLLQLKAALELGAITAANYNTSIKKLLKDQEEVDQITKKKELLSEMAETQKEIVEEAEKYTKGLEKTLATARAIGNDPKVFGAFLLGQAVHKAKELVESFEHFHHLGLTAGQSIDAMQKSFSIMSMVGLADNKGVIEGMIQSYGSMNALTNDQIDTVGALAHKMGVAGQEAFAMVDAFSKMPGETAESAINAAEFTKHLATANGIAPGAVTKEIAQNSEAMALFSAGGAKGFAKAAIETKKMGVDLSTAVSLSKGLLDFESSITKQMEASVLLGREINLDKARELALNGKLEEATAEVLKNIGSQEEFEKMNVLQKQALAEATGMSVEQLAKAIDAQQEYNKYHGEEASIWMNTLGYAMDYGSKVGGFLKENGVLLLATVQFLTMGNGLQVVQNGLLAAKNALLGTAKGIAFATSLIYSSERRAQLAHWVKEKAQWLAQKAHLIFLKTQAAFGVKGAEGRAGALGRIMGKGKKSPVDSIVGAAGDKTKEVSDKLSGADDKKGKGSKGFLEGLGDGLASIGKQFVNVVKGAVALGIAGVALGGGFALAMMMVKDVDPIQMIAFAGSLTMLGLTMALLGNIGANVIMGAVAMGILALSLIPAAFAFSLLEGVDTDKIIAFSIALPLLGLAAAGLGLLSPAIAFGAIALTTLGAGMVAVAGGLMILQAAGGIQVFESLTAVASNAAGLGGVAMALMGIGAGLSVMAVAGIAAMPVIASLVALAAVAPALVGLGAAVGGLLGGGEGEGSLKAVEEKLDTLIGVIQKGGVINMDGQKVGEVVALALNTTGG